MSSGDENDSISFKKEENEQKVDEASLDKPYYGGKGAMLLVSVPMLSTLSRKFPSFIIM